MTLKNMPRLKLADLLRRRKMSLVQFVTEFGITTYEGLAIHCERMGAAPPTEAEFVAAVKPKLVNSPQEGVVVLEPPPVVDELSGRAIDPDAPVEPQVKVVTEPAPKPTEPSKKKAKGKKENQPAADETNSSSDPVGQLLPRVYEDD